MYERSLRMVRNVRQRGIWTRIPHRNQNSLATFAGHVGTFAGHVLALRQFEYASIVTVAFFSWKKFGIMFVDPPNEILPVSPQGGLRIFMQIYIFTNTNNEKESKRRFVPFAKLFSIFHLPCCVIFTFICLELLTQRNIFNCNLGFLRRLQKSLEQSP